MIVHAACGGSTNLILHLTAIAYHAGLSRPTVEDFHPITGFHWVLPALISCGAGVIFILTIVVVVVRTHIAYSQIETNRRTHIHGMGGPRVPKIV